VVDHFRHLVDAWSNQRTPSPRRIGAILDFRLSITRQKIEHDTELLETKEMCLAMRPCAWSSGSKLSQMA
jgi:hypothetical protein